MIPSPIHAFVPAEAWRSLDGAGTRRRQLLAGLAEMGLLEIHPLPARGDASMGRRLRSWLADLRGLVAGVNRIRRGTALLFYPDLPCYHPPGWIKSMGLPPLVAALRALRRRDGCSLWIDAVDLPRHQAPELAYPLRLPAPLLRTAERLLFRSAGILSIPSPGLAEFLRRDLPDGAPPPVVLPNGARRAWLATARRRSLDPDEPVRFLYAGDLRGATGRALESWIETFVAEGAAHAELHLVGPHGEWIAKRVDDGRIHVHAGRDDEAWIELARRCHVGLMPYPETPYFSRCMPSKLAAYAAAGLRILSSRLEESARWIEGWKLGRCLPLEAFPGVFASPRRFVADADSDGGPLPGWEEALCWEARLSELLGDQARGFTRLGS